MHRVRRACRCPLAGARTRAGPLHRRIAWASIQPHLVRGAHSRAGQGRPGALLHPTAMMHAHPAWQCAPSTPWRRVGTRVPTTTTAAATNSQRGRAPLIKTRSPPRRVRLKQSFDQPRRLDVRPDDPQFVGRIATELGSAWGPRQVAAAHSGRPQQRTVLGAGQGQPCDAPG
jgi:hypothetical protein